VAPASNSRSSIQRLRELRVVATNFLDEAFRLLAADASPFFG
jgi:hypothetical protein